MKIAYCIDHLRSDGSQKVLFQIVKGMHNRGHSQLVFCMNRSWDPVLRDAFEALGIKVRVLGVAGILSGIALFKTLWLMKREKVDVVMTMLFYADIIGRVLARGAGVPRVVSAIRARNVFYKPWQRWLARVTMPLADVVVLNSQHLKAFAAQEEGMPTEKVMVIHNGINIPKISRSNPRGFLLERYELPASTTILGSVGRLNNQKGFDVLLQALASIQDLDISLLIAGKGTDLDALRAQADKLGENIRVRFVGYRRDVPDFLAGLDLYVHPARFEGMPNTVMEAMAGGCPIVATAVDGTNELIRDGVDGWLVPPENADALAAGIRVALADKKEALVRGRAARLWVQEKFNLTSKLDEWENLFLRGIPRK